MASPEEKIRDLATENAELRLRLHEAQETLEAIRSGEVDALVVSGASGEQVYTLTGANQVYRVLFETMNEGAATLGSDGTVFFCNTRLSVMLKTPMETIVGSSILEFVTATDTPLVEALLEKGLQEPQKAELALRKLDGNIVPCQVSISPFSVDDSSAICMILTDLTERKRVEEDLVRSNRDLQQFAYVASHDLQEPFRSIISCVQLLEKKYKGKLDADAHRYIDYAVDAAVRMKALIEDLLAYSRIGMRGKECEPTDCEQILAQTVKNLRAAISETGAAITHDPLPTIPADSTQLLQVFQNLIQNSIRFQRNEPPQIHVSAEKAGKEWVFSVRDNGEGIESEYLDRIFVIFQRLHKGAESAGTGIGLAIVKKVVERHGGRVWAESTPNVGSTFYFTIPDRGMLP